MAVRSETVTIAKGSRGTRRLATVTGAVLAAEALWVLIELVFGFDLRTPAIEADRGPSDVGFMAVAVAGGAAALAGWGLLALLERITRRARRWWPAIAAAVLIVSLGGPLSGTGITAANRAGLVLLHVTVAAVLIPGLYRTSPRLPGGVGAALRTEHSSAT